MTGARPSRGLLLVLGVLALVTAVNLASMVQGGQTPWRWVAGAFVFAVLLLGVVGWAISVPDRVAGAIIAAAVLVVEGVVGLREGFPGPEFEAVLLGLAGGFLLTVAVELTVLPAGYGRIVDSD